MPGFSPKHENFTLHFFVLIVASKSIDLYRLNIDVRILLDFYWLLS